MAASEHDVPSDGHSLWQLLPDEMVTRIVDLAPPAALPVLLQLERRARTHSGLYRLRTLKYLHNSQDIGRINAGYEGAFEARDIIGAKNAASHIEIFQADEWGVEAIASGLHVGISVSPLLGPLSRSSAQFASCVASISMTARDARLSGKLVGI